MVRNVFIIIACFLSLQAMAQKPQRIGYIDMEYILENVPEYAEAQAKLNQKVQDWQKELDAIKRDIEVLKTDLSNEKALLTKELIAEREEDIEIRQLDLKNLQAAYFGPTGDLYLMRKQLVKPIQDQVYNAVQEIAVRKKYDMILDKSSDLIMLYTNKKFDESETILNRIVKNRKTKALEEKRVEKLSENTEAIEERSEAIEAEKEAKNNALQERIKAQQDARAKKREELKKAAEERRQQRLEEIKKRREERENKIEQLPTNTKSDSLQTETAAKILPAIDSTAIQKKDSARNAKREALLERARLAKEAKEKRRQEIIKAREEKRKKRLEELEKQKKDNNKEETNNN